MFIYKKIINPKEPKWPFGAQQGNVATFQRTIAMFTRFEPPSSILNIQL
jgi:hypothetical protein